MKLHTPRTALAILSASAYLCSSLCTSCKSLQSRNNPLASLFGGGPRPLPSAASPPPSAGPNGALPLPKIAEDPTPANGLAGLPTPGLQHVNGNVWRISLQAGEAYKTLLKSLSQRYIILVADKRSMSLQTDWDKFYIQDKLFRNRISVRLFPLSLKQTEIIFNNQVEHYSAWEGSTQAWLPTPDITDEIQRIVIKSFKVAKN